MLTSLGKYLLGLQVLLYAVHLCLKFMVDWKNPIMFYWADVQCMPLVLTLTDWLLKQLKGSEFQLSFAQLSFITIYFSVAFELLLPYFSSQFTADIWDVVCYLLGSIFYWSYLRKVTFNG